MSAPRRRLSAGLGVAALCVALAACGPADTGAAGLQSAALGTSAAVGTSAAAAGPTSAPTTASSSTAAAPPLSASAKVSTSSSSASPTKQSTRAAAPTPTTPAKAAVTLTASIGDGSLGDGSIRYGDESTFTITARTPTPGGDLTGHVAVLDGTSVVVEGDTDAAGSAALSFLNTADPGSKSYKVTYTGNPKVAGAAIDVPVRTTRTNVDISIVWPDDLAPGKDVTVSADIIGTPQTPSGQATIMVDGVQITGAAIKDDGTITGTAKAVPAGDHAVEVSYAGDVRFEANTATATMSLRQAPANPNQAGAAAAQASNPCPAAASACVDLSGQQAWLQSAGKITYGPVPITSGREGHRTGTGMFSVFWRDKDHRSSIFNDAPMPNSVFFDDGIAFHEGSLSDQSHGCIHLSWDASETFFDTLSVGDNVYVWGTPPY